MGVTLAGLVSHWCERGGWRENVEAGVNGRAKADTGLARSKQGDGEGRGVARKDFVSDAAEDGEPLEVWGGGRI